MTSPPFIAIKGTARRGTTQPSVLRACIKMLLSLLDFICSAGAVLISPEKHDRSELKERMPLPRSLLSSVSGQHLDRINVSLCFPRCFSSPCPGQVCKQTEGGTGAGNPLGASPAASWEWRVRGVSFSRGCAPLMSQLSVPDRDGLCTSRPVHYRSNPAWEGRNNNSAFSKPTGKLWAQFCSRES